MPDLEQRIINGEFKLPLYAAAGISEAWLVDLPEETIEVHSGPSVQGYSNIHKFRKGDIIHTTTIAELSVEVILG